MTRTKMYLAGPMTGYKYFNLPAFFEAEELAQNYFDVVLNPGRNAGGEDWEEAFLLHYHNPQPWEWYMRHDLKWLLEADTLWTLPEWENSKGASLEVYVATQIGIQVFHGLLNQFTGERVQKGDNE